MKKLLTLGAIAIGTLAYSASLSWSLESFSYKYASDTATAYLITISDSAYANSMAIAKYITENSYSSFVATTGVTQLDAQTSATTDYWELMDEANQTYAAGAATTVTSLSTDDVLYVVIVNADGKDCIVSESQPIIAGDSIGSYYEDVTFTTWVPEPTSLALLALGVAGLALRRKVA